MRRIKYTGKRKTFSLKAVTLVLSIILVSSFVISGTVAWLIDKTDSVKNTFTYGDINITITETDTGDNDGDINTNEYVMIPGNKIGKDPYVTVQAGSEDSWLFVKLEKSANFDSFMTYEMAEGWIALEGQEGVYYREVYKEDVEQGCPVIKDNLVTVKDTVTKEMLNALDMGGASNYPTLTVTAYAVQRDSNITTAADAWAIANGN